MNELREYLTQANSQKISEYVEHCLTAGFTKSGLVLQDLVNELGRRLEYDVSNGHYQGTSGNFPSVYVLSAAKPAKGFSQ